MCFLFLNKIRTFEYTFDHAALVTIGGAEHVLHCCETQVVLPLPFLPKLARA